MAAPLALRLVHLPYVEIGLLFDVIVSQQDSTKFAGGFSVAFLYWGGLRATLKP